MDKINAAFEGGLERGGAATGRQDGRAADRPEDQPRALRGSRRVPRASSTRSAGSRCASPRTSPIRDGRDRIRSPGWTSSRDARRSTATRRSPTCARATSRATWSPTSARIGRQQQFLRAVLNRLLSPGEIAKAPVAHPARRAQPASPTRASTSRTSSIWSSSSRASRRARWSSARFPGRRRDRGSARRRAPSTRSPDQIFARIRQGKPLGDLGQNLAGTLPSEANIVVPVVDHGSAGTAAKVEQILADAGFDTSRRGSSTTRRTAPTCTGSVIAYKPGHQSEAEVVQKYFPGLAVAGGAGRRAARHVRWRSSSPARLRPAAGGQRRRARRAAWPAGVLMRGAHPGGGRGVAAAAAHPHQREAADPGRGRADPVPRARGDPRRRASPRSGSWSGRRATRSAPPSATDRPGGSRVTYIPQDAPLGLAHAVHDGRATSSRASRS